MVGERSRWWWRRRRRRRGSFICAAELQIIEACYRSTPLTSRLGCYPRWQEESG